MDCGLIVPVTVEMEMSSWEDTQLLLNRCIVFTSLIMTNIQELLILKTITALLVK